MEEEISHEFVLPPLLSGVSYPMSNSDITGLKKMKQGFTIYGALAANTATGKSPAMDLVRDSLLDIEEYQGIIAQDSPLINGCPVFCCFDFDIVITY